MSLHCELQTSDSLRKIVSAPCAGQHSMSPHHRRYGVEIYGDKKTHWSSAPLPNSIMYGLSNQKLLQMLHHHWHDDWAEPCRSTWLQSRSHTAVCICL